MTHRFDNCSDPIMVVYIINISLCSFFVHKQSVNKKHYDIYTKRLPRSHQSSRRRRTSRSAGERPRAPYYMAQSTLKNGFLIKFVEPYRKPPPGKVSSKKCPLIYPFRRHSPSDLTWLV